MLELVEAGFTPLAALQAATTVNAELLKLDKQDRPGAAGLRSRPPGGGRQSAASIRATLLDPLLVLSNGRIGLDRLTFAK